MKEIVLKIDGMMCGMCEAHMNDAIRRHFEVEKVTSSHKKGETVILTEGSIERDAIEKVVSEMGYRLLDMSEKAYEKKGLFSFWKK